MNRQTNYPNVIINNFGQMVRQSTLEAVEYKAFLVKTIMIARHKLNYEFDMVMFDLISDMDIDELERLDMEYQDQLIRYGK